MRLTSIVPLLLVTLIGVGAAFWLDAKEARKPWPKATPPPPPSPIYTPSKETAPGESEIVEMAREHNQRLAATIERALIEKDAGQREAAFTFLLPELVQVDPERVIAMLENLERGEARDTLRTEVARQWIARDPAAAVRWMKTLPEDERLASVKAAVQSIVAHSPAEAAALTREFGKEFARTIGTGDPFDEQRKASRD
ncbi:MAG TPA: hypothetical protein VFU13_08855 [Steroidobacteraceae bacterium]|nr:hypothetical protein [Steroidobacteraceae bacterium]